jgi:DNA polymerase III gamma/tau subunit
MSRFMTQLLVLACVAAVVVHAQQSITTFNTAGPKLGKEVTANNTKVNLNVQVHHDADPSGPPQKINGTITVKHGGASSKTSAASTTNTTSSSTPTLDSSISPPPAFDSELKPLWEEPTTNTNEAEQPTFPLERPTVAAATAATPTIKATKLSTVEVHKQEAAQDKADMDRIVDKAVADILNHYKVKVVAPAPTKPATTTTTKPATTTTTKPATTTTTKPATTTTTATKPTPKPAIGSATATTTTTTKSATKPATTTSTSGGAAAPASK